MRWLILLLFLLPAPLQAQTVFDRAAGTWGLTDYAPLSCATNPHEVSFSADHGRALFRWDSPIVNYEGDWDLEGAYDVLGSGPDYIVLALDGESRRTREGEPVVWIMRLIDGDSRYCWGRTDWPTEDCIDRYARCPAPPPLS